ncbi:putative endonuclease [Pelagirhabdus alkalitolerans]|uniref:Putative endonuclease n=1 Tax=Pelagirhabdus alkalitolerans TaxID=1612202 RepID=A0A1G6MM75_9BACI|nr:GIY-YIG nuclease family protein [Pelagirhabdus alkalitolerans]SDC56055.1 putative endonuclease [Pelagirhabdus alkalitolerans]
MCSNHYVYILKCKDRSYYTGYTTNVEHRLKMHESNKGAKYTRGRGPFQLCYVEACESKSEALRREYQIKQLSKQQKMALIDQNEVKKSD